MSPYVVIQNTAHARVITAVVVTKDSLGLHAIVLPVIHRVLMIMM